MPPIRVRDGLQVPEVDGDDDAGADQDDDQYGPRVLEPPTRASNPEMLDVVAVDIVESLAAGQKGSAVVGLASRRLSQVLRNCRPRDRRRKPKELSSSTGGCERRPRSGGGVLNRIVGKNLGTETAEGVEREL